VRVVMIEPDIVVDKGGLLELLVLFDCKECDQVFEDHGIQIMDAVKGEAVKADRNDGGDGSHVQEGFGWRLKEKGLIYPENDPE